ncbi:hypothetical protein [Aquimarina agarivorans]|uniref:hypothetical protein n=1 Tax=Aquimarina agarivorans TaxID=980584 RepID=UPI000248EBEF|nr:hypothetical protein [Aquimarina agarivorans]
MKKAVLILGFLVISLGAFAQKRSDFQGPKYKNYKYWQHDNAPTVVYSSDQQKSLTGPAYKNYKPWRNTKEVSKVEVITNGTNERQKLTGPKYKNYKPWKNNS